MFAFFAAMMPRTFGRRSSVSVFVKVSTIGGVGASRSLPEGVARVNDGCAPVTSQSDISTMHAIPSRSATPGPVEPWLRSADCLPQ